MNLNYDIIQAEVSEPPEYVIKPAEESSGFSRVRWLDSTEDIFDDQTMYFGTWDILKEKRFERPLHVICIGGGKEAESFFSERVIDGMIFRDTEPTSLFDSIQDVFFKYDTLDRRVMEMIVQSRSTQEILNACSEFFHGHVILYDSTLNLLDYSTTYMPDNMSAEWSETLSTSKISLALFSKIRELYSISNSETTSDAVFFRLFPEFPNRISCSLYYQAQRIGTIAVAETESPLHEYQVRILDHLASVLSTTIATRYASVKDSMGIVRRLFVNILRGIENDQGKITEQLQLINWKPEDDYCLLCISFPSGKNDFRKSFRQLYEYENTFPDCVAFRYHDSLIMVIHNDSIEKMVENTPKLEKILEKYKAECGVGIPFYSISRLPEQYINAQLALQVGDKKERIRYLHQSIPQLFHYLFSNTTTIVSLCHRSAVKLIEYDNLNGTQYLKTLKAYLKHNRSIKDAADELYIHRNTLTYRLRCMRDIADIHLDDPDECLMLLVSCIILESILTL